MQVRCIWEHNGDDTILYCEEFPGAFARGESLEGAVGKIPGEIRSYLNWRGLPVPERVEVSIQQEKASALQIRDADSDVLFEREKLPLSRTEYEALKALALASAADFQKLYDSVPDKTIGVLAPRRTFYGPVPRTAEEMYVHTRSVNAYYFAEIGVEADNEGTIAECRQRGFEALEAVPGFLEKEAEEGSYGEWWSLRKVLRRFLWHDRIHGKAMYRMAVKLFGAERIADPFRF